MVPASNALDTSRHCTADVCPGIPPLTTRNGAF